MFPLRDDNPTINTSVATFLIIGLNVLSWIFLQGAGFHPGLLKSVWQYGLIPGELLQTIAAGTQVPVTDQLSYVVEPDARYYTIITSMFMHGGWLHLLGNMWFLFVFGDNVEDSMGPFRFVLFYSLCGFSASALQSVFDPASVIPMVGASGAIGGVMGAYARLFPRAPVHTFIFVGFYAGRIIVPAFVMLGYWFFLQLVSGVFSTGASSGGVAVWAHVGGFLAGIGSIRFFCNNNRLASCRDKRGVTDQFFRRYNKS